MNETSVFDLTDDAWIPGRLPDGRVAEHGVRETLHAAHLLVGITGDLPTQTFALTRLLLAVLHGALRGPKDIDEWGELWRADRLPAGQIDDYLDRHQERFALFHPRTPFMQVADLTTPKGETSELSKLIADVPNGVPVFATRRGVLTLTFAEAARWLVHCHAFDSSGIKSGAVGDDRVKGGKGYPIGVAWSGLLGGVLLEGSTLKETLLLNLLAADSYVAPRDPAVDLPAWERAPSTAAEEVPEGRPPTGPVDLYTWQSRRVRLVPEGGQVTRVLIANGERLTPQNRHMKEPHTAWRRSETQEKKLGEPLVYMPREHDPDRSIWRGLQSLLPGASSRHADKGGSRWVAPGVLEWLDVLVGSELVAQDHLVRVRATGMVYGSNSSVVDDVVHDTLSLRASLARHDAVHLAAVVTSCVDVAEKVVRTVGNLAGDLVAATGGNGAGPRSRIIEQLYGRCDSPFREWLQDIGVETDLLAAQTRWHKTMRGFARDVADDLLRSVPPAAWAGHKVRGAVLTAAHAEARFRRDLRAAAPFAYEPSAPAARETV